VLPLHDVLCRHRHRSDKAHSALANRSRDTPSASILTLFLYCLFSDR
jgi:hypothetical protein